MHFEEKSGDALSAAEEWAESKDELKAAATRAEFEAKVVAQEDALAAQVRSLHLRAKAKP